MKKWTTGGRNWSANVTACLKRSDVTTLEMLEPEVMQGGGCSRHLSVNRVHNIRVHLVQVVISLAVTGNYSVSPCGHLKQK